MPHTTASISVLDQLLSTLSASEQSTFGRLFHTVTTVGELRTPAAMQPWILKQFGSVEAVERQKITRVTNLVTFEDVLFNTLRSQRPIQMRNGPRLAEELMKPGVSDPLCQPLEGTPEDVFGRVRGKYSVTAGNVAKLDKLSSLVVFDTFNPLQFTREQVVDYLHTGWGWAQRAHEQDPTARYYFFLWNCLWRAGASLLHGHAQTLLGRDMHYGKVEHLRRSALRYREETGADYFEDLYAAHEALGLGFSRDGVRILAYLTPTKEKETLIMAEPFNPALPERVYDVLACFRDKLGVASFNLTLYQGTHWSRGRGLEWLSQHRTYSRPR